MGLLSFVMHFYCRRKSKKCNRDTETLEMQFGMRFPQWERKFQSKAATQKQ